MWRDALLSGVRLDRHALSVPGLSVFRRFRSDKARQFSFGNESLPRPVALPFLWAQGHHERSAGSTIGWQPIHQFQRALCFVPLSPRFLCFNLAGLCWMRLGFGVGLDLALEEFGLNCRVQLYRGRPQPVIVQLFA
jgi:hypothetical protein